MQYFDTLPKIVVTNNDGISTIMTNLMTRASIIPSIFKNPLVYYGYDIQEGDTPEIIAHKYYDDSYRYWVVLFANQLLDPQWDWPIPYTDFQKYIESKYEYDSVTHNWNVLNPYETVHHYEKIITQVDGGTNTTTVNKVVVDEAGYADVEASLGTTSYHLPTGTVTITISGNIVNYYDYEFELNESKRSIKLLNQIYVDQLENELKKLMG